ncbi:MAG TPA: class IV adenylate cyclase [Desulfurococcales archaeon]|nr:class IV adenylate cyclase [Desulfurococcales archaeon]
MLEVEVKYRVENVDYVKSRLVKLGAKHIETVVEVDYYYQHPCRDFKKSDEALRIRVSNGKYTLTYKGPRIPGAVKAREEISVEFRDFKKLDTILRKLGFKHLATIVKKRDIYALGEFKISVDEVEGLGEFIEIEHMGYTGTKGIQDVASKINHVIKCIGVKGPCILKSYLELLLESKQ